MNKIPSVLWTIGAVCGIGALIGWFNIRREAADDPQITDPQIGEFIITVKSNGGLFLNGIEFSEEHLATPVNAFVAMYPDQAIIVRGDAEADFQQIIRVLDLIKNAGIWNVAFATA